MIKIKSKDASVDPDGRKKTPVYSKVFTVLGIILCIILLPILILNIFMIISGMSGDKNTLPNVGGYSPLIVQSGSMSGTIEEGDLIIVHAIDDASRKDLKKDEIVTFHDKIENGSLVTHRIIGQETDKKGELVYITKGDANDSPDPQRLAPERIAAVYCFRIPFLGGAAMFMQTVPGLIVCIIFPLGLFLIYDIIRRRSIAKASQLENERLLAELNELKKQQTLSASPDSEQTGAEESGNSSDSEEGADNGNGADSHDETPA